MTSGEQATRALDQAREHATRALRPRTRSWVGGEALFLLGVAAVVADAATTLLGMLSGRTEEANPAARALMEVAGLVPAVVLASAVALVLCALVRPRPRSVPGWSLLGLGAVVVLGKLWVSAANTALLWSL